MINFGFNQNSQRYHYLDGEKKGQFVSKAQVKVVVQSYIDSHKLKYAEISHQLAIGKIDINQWEKQTAKVMKDITINTYKIGKPNPNFSDWGKVGAQLKKQYLYLRNFSRQIEKGNLSEGQITARANQYLQAVWSFYNAATREAHKSAGYSWERRNINSKHPCPQCPEYAALGWQPLGTLPHIGQQCDCQANCKCSFEFSQSNSKPQERLSANLLTLLINNR
jgi:hypothetical protein